jgi:hypothetical protein
MRLEDHPTVKRYREKNQATAPSVVDKLDAEWLKNMVLEAGADDAGLVEINRPELNDYRADILEILFYWIQSSLTVMRRPAISLLITTLASIANCVRPFARWERLAMMAHFNLPTA